MLLIEYVGHIGLRSLTDGHLGHHLEYFKTLNDARVASLGFIKYNAPTTRINKEKNFEIKFQVILVFYQTSTYNYLFSLEAQHKSSILFVVTIAITKHIPEICFVDVLFAKNGICWPKKGKRSTFAVDQNPPPPHVF